MQHLRQKLSCAEAAIQRRGKNVADGCLWVHNASMAETLDQLLEARTLLEQALRLVDELGEIYVGILIETALQEIIAKIDAAKGVQ